MVWFCRKYPHHIRIPHASSTINGVSSLHPHSYTPCSLTMLDRACSYFYFAFASVVSKWPPAAFWFAHLSVLFYHTTRISPATNMHLDFSIATTINPSQQMQPPQTRSTMTSSPSSRQSVSNAVPENNQLRQQTPSLQLQRPRDAVCCTCLQPTRTTL